ncbi:MurR/RpiR family transcriptional regulator [Marinococcus luteus]|uniref:MurR/RpiR family transcriptional regulator n=1 Tax=Marinococcus luteus TaxID=1122204 RepID=UPI002ACC983E|nr:MurR/RpiR family transcriptional regulator [Marinococcus luteus]MDZ5782588.1 MurR/RpiR family transcriptional regulator [Marinococcus luteus]
MKDMNVYKLIAEKMSSMTKTQQKLGRYILQHPNQATFLKVGELAEEAGVGDATVVRFAVQLGFSGYPALQERMQVSLQQQLSTAEKMYLSEEVYKDEAQGIQQIFLGEQDNIQATLKQLDINAFHQVVQDILGAKRVYIIANRSAKALGIFMHYYLTMMIDKVEMIELIEEQADTLYGLNEQDLVVGISYARYTKRTTEVFSYAKGKGAKTAALTDTWASPLVPHADNVLTAESQMPAMINSFVGPLSVINALLIYTGRQKQSGFEKKLQDLEEVWNNFQVFE